MEPLPASLTNGVGYLLARAGGRAIRDFNRALQSVGLRSRHYTVLVAAAESAGRSQRDLSIALGIDPSALVAIVDDLVQADLVRRDPHPEDRRTRLIVATDLGQDRLQHLRSLARDVDDELQAGLDPHERSVLLELLRRITAD